MSFLKNQFGDATPELRAFLTNLSEDQSVLLDTCTNEIEKEVWAETACMACANCCRTMSPVFTTEYMKRIATYLRMSVAAFKEKWLYKTKNGDWMNRSQPCPFLDLHSNACSVYAVRPADCASFPHLAKKRLVDYVHVHRQNISYCPATYKMVTKLMHLTDDMMPDQLCDSMAF